MKSLADHVFDDLLGQAEDAGGFLDALERGSERIATALETIRRLKAGMTSDDFAWDALDEVGDDLDPNNLEKR